MALIKIALDPLRNVRGMFFGWWLVALGALVLVVGVGPLFHGMPAWNVAMRHKFGWGGGQLSLAWSFQRVEGTIMGPIGGYLIDKLGPRRMVLVGLLVMGGGFLLFSRVENLWMFYLSFVIMSAGAGLGTWLPVMTMLNNWFFRRRGLAMALAIEGIYVGGVALPPLLGWAIDPDENGPDRWRTVAAIIGTLTIIVAIPISRLIRDRPEDYGQRPDGRPEISLAAPQTTPSGNASSEEEVDYSMREALRTRAFWLISFGHSFSAMVNVTIMVHLGLLLDDRQLSLTMVGLVVATIMAVSALFTLLGGLLGDRIPVRYSLFWFALVQSVAVVVLILADSLAMAFVFAVLMGIGWGGRSAPTSAIRGIYFGRKAFASITGMSMVPMNCFLLGGPLFAGYMRDARGNYDLPFVAIAVVSLLGSCLYLFLRKPQSPSAELRAREVSASLTPLAGPAGCHRPNDPRNKGNRQPALVGGLEGQGGIPHEDAPAGFCQRAVEHQACNYVPGSRHPPAAYFHPVRAVYAHYGPFGPADRAVYPDLAVVIEVALEIRPGTGNLKAIYPLGQLDGDAVPGEGKAYGNAFPDVGPHIPARVIVVRQAGGSRQELGCETFVGLPGYQPRCYPPLCLDLLPVFRLVQVQCQPWHSALLRFPRATDSV